MDLVDGCSSKLSELITISFSKRNIFLQRNACAALTAIMTCDPSLYLAAAKAPTLVCFVFIDWFHFFRLNGCC